MEVETVEVEETIAPARLGDDINADLTAAIEEVSGRERGEDGKFKVKEEAEPAAESAPVEAEIPKPPQSWTAEAKAEWANASPRIREEILKRENDITKMTTHHEGELRLGREIKDIVAPYMPLIQAAGSTPATTINNLLNTAYKLQTGDESTRATIIKQIAKDYGVKLEGLTDSEEYVDPTIAQLHQKIAQLEQMANPDAIESRLRERLEGDKVQQDIAAFASDPAHVHFETVKPLMASILNAGQAKDLKEAYDMACMANPAIRSTLEAAKNAEMEAKRKQEISQKKRAASSITGSPAVTGNSKVTNPKSSPQDDLRAVWDDLESQI